MVHVTYYLVSIAYDPALPRSVQRNYKLSESPGAFRDFSGLSAPIIYRDHRRVIRMCQALVCGGDFLHYLARNFSVLMDSL
jgi:hypothetical protein